MLVLRREESGKGGNGRAKSSTPSLDYSLQSVKFNGVFGTFSRVINDHGSLLYFLSNRATDAGTSETGLSWEELYRHIAAPEDMLLVGLICDGAWSHNVLGVRSFAMALGGRCMVPQCLHVRLTGQRDVETGPGLRFAVAGGAGQHQDGCVS